MFVRSSGPGGQNVNKVNTKVELRFNVLTSESLSSGDIEIICKRLKNRINSNGELILTAQNTRSQLSNKLIVTEQFFTLIEDALKPVKKRKPSKPSKSAIEKRLKLKRIKAEIKKFRKGSIE